MRHLAFVAGAPGAGAGRGGGGGGEPPLVSVAVLCTSIGTPFGEASG